MVAEIAIPFRSLSARLTVRFVRVGCEVLSKVTELASAQFRQEAFSGVLRFRAFACLRQRADSHRTERQTLRSSALREAPTRLTKRKISQTSFPTLLASQLLADTLAPSTTRQQRAVRFVGESHGSFVVSLHRYSYSQTGRSRT